ncbi:hypothetical protein PR048_002945 [Dryococelus australis]|uniref:W2 domain-containing protein n=1 Tax=Dryococelus australis TaxID=614101 RepID=A0ABQ9ILQ0_9NEOP|nr:hypothetical protein PR048_002945 [Dryococelus australis]
MGTTSKFFQGKVNVPKRQNSLSATVTVAKIPRKHPKGIQIVIRHCFEVLVVFRVFRGSPFSSFCLFVLIVTVLNKINLMLQPASPQIHILLHLSKDLLKGLFEVCNSSCNQECSFPRIVGCATQRIIGTLPDEEKVQFFLALGKYFGFACDYIFHKFPLKNEILHRSRDEALDELQKQFAALQMEVMSALISEVERVDIITTLFRSSMSNTTLQNISVRKSTSSQIFQILWDENVVSSESFIAWEKSTDPQELNGKAVALKSLTTFFTALKEAEEESSCEESPCDIRHLSSGFALVLLPTTGLGVLCSIKVVKTGGYCHQAWHSNERCVYLPNSSASMCDVRVYFCIRAATCLWSLLTMRCICIVSIVAIHCICTKGVLYTVNMVIGSDRTKTALRQDLGPSDICKMPFPTMVQRI